MKSIKEKEQLIKMSMALGVEPDPKMVKEVLEYKQMMADVKKSSGLGNVFKEMAQIHNEPPPQQPLVIPRPPSLDEITFLFEDEVKEAPKVILEIPKPPTLEELLEQLGSVEEDVPIIEEEPKNKLIDLASTHIAKEAIKEQRAASIFQEPEIPLPQSLNDLKRKVKMLEEWITKISMTGPGSGEVNLLKLDDVDTSSIGDNKFLRFNAANNKIEFATVDGGFNSNNGTFDSNNITFDGLNFTFDQDSESIDLTNVNSNIVPTIDSTFNLGSANKRFKTLFLANNTIDLGGSLISSDGTGQISISGTGAVLPSGSKIDVGPKTERIALVGDTGSLISVVPFFTQQLGLNTIAVNFEFGANQDDFVFKNFIFVDGSGLEQAGTTQFFF